MILPRARDRSRSAPPSWPLVEASIDAEASASQERRGRGGSACSGRHRVVQRRRQTEVEGRGMVARSRDDSQEEDRGAGFGLCGNFRAPHARVDATSSLRLRLLDGVGGSHATLIHIHAGARPEEEEEGRDREAREDARPARVEEDPAIRQPIYDRLLRSCMRG